jgi:hypothetical protein
MKKSTKNQLDQLQRQERIKNVFRISCIAIAVLLLLSALIIYRYSSGKITEVSGVVTGLHGVPVSKLGEIPYLMVTLDNGNVVEVKKPNGILYKKGNRVKLMEIKTSIFGNVRYDFVAYAKEI